MSAEDLLISWLQPTVLLFDLEVVRRIYAKGYRLLPSDVRRLLRILEADTWVMFGARWIYYSVCMLIEISSMVLRVVRRWPS